MHRGFDVGVAHKLHQRGQADAGAHHVRGEGMSEPVGIGQLDAGVHEYIHVTGRELQLHQFGADQRCELLHPGLTLMRS